MGFLSNLFGKPKDDPLKSAMQAIYRMIDDEVTHEMGAEMAAVAAGIGRR